MSGNAQVNEVMLALTAWRENRGALTPGMTSVINVVMNRSYRDNTTPYAECVKRLQFSSITAPDNPELNLWPVDGDPQFVTALDLANQALAGTLADITGGATDYYAPLSIQSPMKIRLPSGVVVPFPKGWNQAAVQYTSTIGSQVFFKEI